MASGRSRKKKINDNWESELLEEGSKFIEKYLPQKPKKKCYFEFHTNSITGRRETVHPYKPRFKDCLDDADKVDDSDPFLPCSSTCTSGLEDDNVEAVNELNEVAAEESLEETIERCQYLVSSLPSLVQSWDDRMFALNENWDNCRSQLFEAIISDEGLTYDQVCDICKKSKVVLRCFSCHGKKLCRTCDLDIHGDHPFHDRDVFVNGCFMAVPPTTIVSGTGDLLTTRRCPSLFRPNHCPFCMGRDVTEHFRSSGTLIIVNEKGRFDFSKPYYHCTTCVKDVPFNLSTIVQAGYWPGSPNDVNYVFHQDLFLLWNALQKRMPGTSETAFVRSLEDLSSLKGRAPTINSTTFSRSFREWKFCQHGLNLEQQLNWMECPPCSIDQHSCHVDGNMKLYRYKTSGSQRVPSYYGDCFIANKEDVDEHIKNVYSKQQRPKGSDDNSCGESHWKAAENKLRKKAHLDETGLEIAGCRHGLAQWAVNMYRGEIYGYPHYIQSKKMQPAKVSFFWEDVVCKYWKWAQRAGILVGDMKPALSVMHAKAHSWSCQIIWGGRWQNGSACSTGEEVEQINSYMSRCGNTTKYMLPESRDELLTEHALAWNRRKITRMIDSLCHRYTRAIKMKSSSVNALNDAVTEKGLLIDESQLQKWKLEAIQYATASQMLSKDESELATIQQQMEMLYFSTVQTKSSMNKLAGTSKQRTRLRKRIVDNKAKLKVFVERYNKLVDERGNEQSHVNLEDVDKGIFVWERNLRDTPMRVKSHVVELSEISKRWAEEVELVLKEMKNFIKFYAEITIPEMKKQLTALKRKLQDAEESAHKLLPETADTSKPCKVLRYSTTSDAQAVIRGKLGCVSKGLMFCKIQVKESLTKFQKAARESGSVLGLGNDELESADELCDAFLADDGEIDDDDDDSDSMVNFIGSAHVETNEISSSAILGKPSVGLDSVFTWEFPLDISQSTFQGRNGSNACSVIALVFADGVTKLKMQLRKSPSLCPQWTKLMCYSIRIGNLSYDRCRESLPQRFLSAAEAAMVVSNCIDVSVSKPLPVRVCDPHDRSTLVYQLSALRGGSQDARCALFITGGKTVLFLALKDTFIHVDTHRHENCGAIITLGSVNNLAEFISRCQNVMELDKDIYGNFSILTF